MKLKLSFLFLMLVGLAVAGYVYFRSLNKPDVDTLRIIPPNKNFNQKNDTKTTLLSGSIKELTEDLKLTVAGGEFEPGTQPKTYYYEAGTYNTGTYSNYKRIIAVKEPEGPGGPSTYVFATNGDGQYVLDGNPTNLTKFKEGDWQHPLTGLDKSKVTRVEFLDSYQDEAIDLDTSFSLFRVGLETDNTQTSASVSFWALFSRVRVVATA